MKKIILVALLTTSLIRCMEQEKSAIKKLEETIAIDRKIRELTGKFILFNVPNETLKDVTSSQLPTIIQKVSTLHALRDSSPMKSITIGEKHVPKSYADYANPSTKYKCRLCKRGYKSRQGINRHLATQDHKKKLANNNNREDLIIPCCPEPGCNFLTNKITKQRHADWHKGGQEDQKLCDPCQLALTPSTMKRHLESEKHQKNKAINQNINNKK